MPDNLTSCSSSPSSFSATTGQDTERKRKLTTQTSKAPTMTPTPMKPTVLRFEISDFARLAHPKGSFVETRSIQILDRSWHLRVYPRGHGRSRPDKVLVSCFLTVGDEHGNERPQDESDLEFSFRIRDWRMVPKRCGFRSNVAYGFMGHSREKILQQGLQEDGSLVVDVALKFWSPPPPQTNSSLVWYPNKKPKRKPNLAGQLYRSQEFADLAFLVGQKIFKAHKCVLALRARTLLELALHDDDEDEKEMEHTYERNENFPIRIPNVEEDVFEAFLDYVYTFNEERLLKFLGTNEMDLGPAKSLLVVADKFGATDLKMFVESVLADRFLSHANCCEVLLLADSHWCGLLKEQALDLYCSDPMASIEGGNGYELLKESPKLLSELLVRSAKTARRSKIGSDTNRTPNRNRNHTLEDLAVGTLRDRLEEVGLDPDGSKEILVRRYRDHHHNSSTHQYQQNPFTVVTRVHRLC